MKNLFLVLAMFLLVFSACTTTVDVDREDAEMLIDEILEEVIEERTPEEPAEMEMLSYSDDYISFEYPSVVSGKEIQVELSEMYEGAYRAVLSFTYNDGGILKDTGLSISYPLTPMFMDASITLGLTYEEIKSMYEDSISVREFEELTLGGLDGFRAHHGDMGPIDTITLMFAFSEPDREGDKVYEIERNGIITTDEKRSEYLLDMLLDTVNFKK
jgi:hypothetical protein